MDPLTDFEPRKKPMVLYIIIGIPLIIIIVLSILLAVKSGNKEKNEDPIDPVKNDHLIPIKESFYINDTDDGATKYKGRGKHLNSEYYKILDIYNMAPTKSRSILTHFKTYKQTSEYSSPCSMIIMVLTYFGIEPPGERTCQIEFGINP